MEKKILYISYDGMTDPLGQSQVLPYLLKLSERGYKFTLLSFEKKERYYKEKDIIKKIIGDTSIHWVPVFFTKKPPFISKLYDRWQMIRTAIRLHRKERFDLIHCRSYIAAEAGLKLRRKYGVRFLFDMRGFWADERVDNGQWDIGKWLYKKIYSYYKKKEKAFLSEADGIISLTQAGKDYLLSLSEYKHLSIDVIPCCADLEHFDFNKISKDKQEQLRTELNIGPDKKILTYIGSIGGWYMTDEMFLFFNRLLVKKPEFVMLILTKDPKDDVMANAVRSEVDPSCIRVLYAPREKVPSYLSLSEYCIFFIRPTFSKKASSPTKHAEIMGMGIPVICNDIGDTGYIINQTGTGVIADSLTASSFDKIINNLPSPVKKNKGEIRQEAFRFFDLQAGANHYEELYKKIFLQ